MLMRISTFLQTAVLIGCLCLQEGTAFAQDVILYVSPQGNDRAEGTLQRPLQTIREALARSRNTAAGGHTSILLRAGVYEQDRTLEVNTDRLTLRAYPGEQVAVSGGRRLRVADLRRVSDPEVAALLPPASRGKVREIDFRRLGLRLSGLHAVGFGRPSTAAWTEVFVDGAPLHLSRWPNDSTVSIGTIQESGISETKEAAPFPVFGYAEDRPSQWKDTRHLWISGYFAHGYADDMIRVASVDTVQRMIHTAQHTVYGFMTGAPWRKWFALNLLEELDAPGEYVLDTDRGKMYLYPPSDRPTEIHVSLLEEPILAIEHCRDVTVEGITFEYGRQIGVYMEDTHRAVLKGCTLRNLGGVGVCIGKGTLAAGNDHAHQRGRTAASRCVGDLMGKVYEDILFNRDGGTANGVEDCRIYQVGAGGVSLGGGDRKTLTPAGNYVRNCRIYRYNRIEKSYRPGVWMDGVGNTLSRCSIYDAPSMAVLFHGNNHLIELCDITNVCSEVDDQGAIYYGRDPSELGHVIRHCYFHELSPRHRVTATYHDDGACGAEVYGNIYFKAGSMPALIGGGHHNTYRHNLFIEGPIAIHVDNRMQDWGTGMVARGGIIDRRLQEVGYDRPPYSTAYPWLPAYWDCRPDFPHDNLIERNLFCRVGNVVQGRTEWLELCGNWVTASDPGWVDPSDPLKGFRPDAPIRYRIPGFPALPFDRIGCTLPEE